LLKIRFVDVKQTRGYISPVSLRSTTIITGLHINPPGSSRGQTLQCEGGYIQFRMLVIRVVLFAVSVEDRIWIGLTYG
jgi:hypothetical protein